MGRKLFAVSFFIAAIAVVVFIVSPSSVFDCERYELRQPPKLKGALEMNAILTKAEYLLKGKIVGPESIIVDGENITTGTLNGMVVLIEDGTLRKFSRFGSPKPKDCDGSFDMEPKCGRPLGLRRLDEQSIVAVDTHLGVFSITFNKGHHAVILVNGTEVDGKEVKFLNDIEVVNSDVMLITESSTKWDRRYYMTVLLEGIPNGRVLRLTRSTGKIDVIMDKLYFANGIQLFPDKQSFLVAETGAARIKRHWIAGPRMGETEIFADNLPGLPDNIRLGSGGTFWVAIAAVRHSEQFSSLDFLADKPWLRKCILQLVPVRYWEWLQSMLAVKHAMILQLNEKGEIIASAHDPKGDVIEDVSEVTEAGQYLYLGSYHAPYIARIRKDLIVPYGR